MPIRGVDSFVSRCTCGGFVLIRFNHLVCDKCGAVIHFGDQDDDVLEIIKPGKPFNPPKLRQI